MRIFLCGEGATELGAWGAKDAAPSPGECAENPGFIGAVLEKIWNREITPEDVGGHKVWKDIRKMKVGGAFATPHRDERNVRALALHARQLGCDVVVFLRDDDHERGRAEAIRAGIEWARARQGAPKMAGGIPKRNLECWLLALTGRSKTERLGKESVKKLLKQIGLEGKNAKVYAKNVREHGLGKIPKDAKNLRGWLEELRGHLAAGEK